MNAEWNEQHLPFEETWLSDGWIFMVEFTRSFGVVVNRYQEASRRAKRKRESRRRRSIHSREKGLKG
jgi:hypothetical protein